MPPNPPTVESGCENIDDGVVEKEFTCRGNASAEDAPKVLAVELVLKVSNTGVANLADSGKLAAPSG